MTEIRDRRWTALLHIDGEKIDVDLEGVSDLEKATVSAAIAQGSEWFEAGFEVTLSTLKTTKAHGTVPSKGYRLESLTRARYMGSAYVR